MVCDTSQVLINMRWGKLLSVSEICSFLWKVKLSCQIAGGTTCTQYTRVVRRPGAALTCSQYLINEKAPKLLPGLPSQSFKGRESFHLVRHHISEDILLNTTLKYQYIPSEAAKIRENETPSVDRGLKNRMLGANWWNCQDAVLRQSVRQNLLLPS